MLGLTAGVAGAATATGLWALDHLANRVVRPVPREADVTVPELGFPHEELAIPGDGHTLAGWLMMPVRDDPGRPVVLLAHGWGANYGTLLRLGEPLAASGYPVLLFDVRGHGRSGSAPYVTVRHFRDDVAAVARWAAARFPARRRVAVGHSMGGAASILAAEAGAPLDGVVSVAGPADVLEVTAAYLREKGLPGGLMVVALRPFWWRRVGGSFRNLVPERKARTLGRPLLVLHPENDHRVTRSHAERLGRAAGVEPCIIRGAGHTDVLGHPETLGRVLAFLDEVGAD